MLHLRGSHKEPLLQHEDLYDPSSLLTRGQEIPELVGVGPRDERVIEGCLLPGEMSLHHLCTAHGGGPNMADTRRVGFNVTYCAGTVESDRPEGAYGMPLLGKMPASMAVDPAPQGRREEERTASHEAKMRGLAATIMHDADLERFSRVSEERVGRNRPAHLPEGVDRGDASATSLASTLLARREGESRPPHSTRE